MRHQHIFLTLYFSFPSATPLLTSQSFRHHRSTPLLLTKLHSRPEKINTYRIFGINTSPDDTPTSSPLSPSTPVPPTILKTISKRYKIPPQAINSSRIVRRSLDARKRLTNPQYAHVIDIDVPPSVKLPHKPGRCEKISPSQSAPPPTPFQKEVSPPPPRVVVIGCGPAGLFAALRLAKSGLSPLILERGEAVEKRGKDIGALVHRRLMSRESNFCFGEGGAGTWSDGKLKTRIGRNGAAVRDVLETFVRYGAPEDILVEGAPHLGTDKMVRILKAMREGFKRMGGTVRFGARVEKVLVERGAVKGVDVTFMGGDCEKREVVECDAVILATGHSARDVYEELASSGVALEPKGFACGFRVEHPQSLINEIQYGKEWGGSVVTGRGSTDRTNLDRMGGTRRHEDGSLPVASYRLATDKAFDGTRRRGAYSFCMCPGGQVVPASTEYGAVCVNGMSFSRRDSLFANAALVATIAPDDEVLEPYVAEHGVLAGVAFQKDMERRAAAMGGGGFVVPVQRMTDFCEGVASVSAPPSSYRLGVTPSACHEIYPSQIYNALKDAIENHFERQMKGFYCEEGLLHGVETRTSSPVRIARDNDSLEAIGVKGLFPAGEGAGFAGGIVSAAVDGIMVAEALYESVGGGVRLLGKKEANVGFDY